MPKPRLILIASLAAPLALFGAGSRALAQAYPPDNPPAPVDDAGPDAGAPSLAIILGSDSDELAMADAFLDHRIDLRVGSGDLTGQEADSVRAELDTIRADAAELVTENGRMTGADRAQLSERLTDLRDEVDELASNPDQVPN